MVLRGPGSLAALGDPLTSAALEIHSSDDERAILVGTTRVPLEVDLTAHRAFVLSDQRIWRLGPLGFLTPAERIQNQLLIHQPFEPGRIPLVLVHGTFSSPVTWAEMVNSLTADPELRRRYQVWSFVYGSGNPLVQSVADLRRALKAQMDAVDPAGTNTVLRQMVVIGHSQGGILTKGTVVNSSNRLWRVFSTNRVEDLKLTETERAGIRESLILEPLPFVKRVVFIATPHRGSYLAGSLPRRIAQRLVSLPSALVSRSADFIKVMSGSETGKFLRGRMPTSLDGMSPRNPGLLALSEIPVVPGVHAHSIIAVRGEGDHRQGRDGLVTYASAHLDGVDSEHIVRWSHTCLNQPGTIGEVRRILHQHLRGVDARATDLP
jgi:pimeloyl-ACP methyl ester carboxylesterase